MTTPLESLVAAGTRLWLDSIDPELVRTNRGFGATGATSNPIIVSDLIKTGRFDDALKGFFQQKLNDEEVAWAVTDKLVRDAQQVFHDVWVRTRGNDGFVSFELDPLLEDKELAPPHAQRVKRYIELGRKWNAGHENRMIKVPATAAGLDALEELAASGITLNVTLIFSQRQYEAARDAVWRGRQRFGKLDQFKSVYSIFVSRVDVYTLKHVPSLSKDAQGQVGILNAKRIWQLNQDFWADKKLPLKQELIFASTGAKLQGQSPDTYVAAFAGSDIQTNPPATNEAVQKLGKAYTARVRELPSPAVQAEIDAKVNPQQLESVLMAEGTEKFAEPHKQLIALIHSKRAALTRTA